MSGRRRLTVLLAVGAVLVVAALAYRVAKPPDAPDAG